MTSDPLLSKPDAPAERAETPTSQGSGGRLLPLWRGLRRLPAEGDVVFLGVVLTGLVIYLSLASPFFLTQRNLTNVLLQASVLAMVAFGVTVVIISGNFDLSVGSGVGLVMVTSALVMQATGSVPLGLAVGVLVGMGMGLLNGILVTVVLVPSFIATLGMLVAARGIGRGIANGQTVGGIPAGFVDFMNSSVLGLRMIVWAAVAVFLFLHVVLRYTRLGVQLFAVGGNPRAARLAGLRVAWIQTAAFLLSSVAVTVAGLALLGRLGSADPNSGTLLELYAVAAVVVGGTSLYGGKGSVLRTLFGVLLIAIIQNGLNLLNINPDLQMAILGAVFILATASGVINRRRK